VTNQRNSGTLNIAINNKQFNK